MNNTNEFTDIETSVLALRSLAFIISQLADKAESSIMPEEGHEKWINEDNFGDFIDAEGADDLSKEQIREMVNIGLIL